MRSATIMLARAWGLAPHGEEHHPCGLCGADAPARPWKDVLRASNTNQADLKSPWVCWACEACLADRRSRSNTLVVDGQYSRPERKQVWPMLLDPPEPPFLLYLTASGKKHGIWRQHVTMSREAFRLQCEELDCVLRPAEDRIWMAACKTLLLAGARRVSLETGKYHSSDYMKVGFKLLRQQEALIKPVRGTDKFALIFGVMPGRDDIGGVEI